MPENYTKLQETELYSHQIRQNSEIAFLYWDTKKDANNDIQTDTFITT